MSSAMSLDELVTGRCVLLVNAIRADVPSGGNTATQALLTRWRERGLCRPHQLDLNPGVGTSMLAFALATLPAALFVQWGRMSGRIWLEFLFRASPWLLLRCVWARWRLRPDVVVLNHHAAFLYRWAFAGSRCVLVWHDVPSLKRDESRDVRRDKRRCAAFERWAIRGATLNATFSFDDARALALLHRRPAEVVPVITPPAAPRTVPPSPGRWLLVGNWTRAENTEGAQAFLLACAEFLARGEATATAEFHVAGHGSEQFMERLRAAHPAVRSLDLRVTARYGEMRDFDEAALLAPLLRGAGIKLKTIEAWAAGIPVVGTRQAFTGMPARLWRRGGLRVPSIEAMARLCLTAGAFAGHAGALDPSGAYAAYRQAIVDSAA
ncbi:glycosyltransferase [Mitsuaria sp. GD03876]|uniref:glycosyltransferase n=1 Tax=Mitsuaria sp. GD03876 TaxID=2975399 RepID=UPI00244BDC5E|nr:glycosyltransferase [Mitsuaria sp. GD03876]MDH0863266.1 glycosyltransferase family 4 protein [Mitsuaria sp. GD03876]